MASDPRQAGKRPVEHMISLVKAAIPPVNRAGLPFIAGGLGLAAIGARHKPVRCLGLAAAGFSAFFFREPSRTPPAFPGAIVAPADGEVCLIDEAAPPAELGLGSAKLQRVSIFLSLLDVHVQRAPLDATVHQVVHTPGEFRSADVPEASQLNERTAVELRTPGGDQLIVVQIAGQLARRIVTRLQPGDRVRTGQTYGLIRFGSRVDVYLPDSATAQAWLGQRTIGGQTIIGTLA